MTTIAFNYDKNEVAVDSRTICGDTISSDNADKTIKCENSLYFLTGHRSDRIPFVHGHNTMTHQEGLECHAYMVKGKKVYLVTLEEGVYKEVELTYNDATGTGWQFALSALDFGKTTKQAVEYAATRDTNTGGQIRVFSVVNNEWQS